MFAVVARGDDEYEGSAWCKSVQSTKIEDEIGELFEECEECLEMDGREHNDISWTESRPFEEVADFYGVSMDQLAGAWHLDELRGIYLARSTRKAQLFRGGLAVVARHGDGHGVPAQALPAIEFHDRSTSAMIMDAIFAASERSALREAYLLLRVIESS